VGKIAHHTHPKDAAVKVNERGEIDEIIEGVFLDEPKPEFRAAIEHKAQISKELWIAAIKALDQRPKRPRRKDIVDRTEVQLGGFGGQGIMSAGRIIGHAATIYDKIEACFTQSYGPEARGGAAGSQVVVATETIHHPHLIAPTSAIIMSQEAYLKYAPHLAADGILLIDDGLVTLSEDHRQDLKTYGIPATQIAEELGNGRAANSAMLGFWTAIVGAVSQAAMRQSLADSVPSKTLEVNLKVFDVGYAKGLELKKNV
jgi:2-oxoglutarate ferredoxin oxidoreductase subunit gamma